MSSYPNRHILVLIQSGIYTISAFGRKDTTSKFNFTYIIIQNMRNLWAMLKTHKT